MSAFETQVGGDHYTKLKIQPMEYSMANKLDACQHTIVKYVTRFRDKGGKRDLEKAMHVIQMLIDLEYPEAMDVGPTIAPMEVNITGADDGWINREIVGRPEYFGMIDVKLRNGNVETDHVDVWDWKHTGLMGDIIAWRPAKEQS